MLKQARSWGSVLALALALPLTASSSPGREGSRVEVCCSRASAFVDVNISNHRRIGVVTIEVRDAKGLTVYREEGKAMTGELIRRLDKGGFQRGAHTLHVVARDFTIAQPFTVE